MRRRTVLLLGLAAAATPGRTGWSQAPPARGTLRIARLRGSERFDLLPDPMPSLTDAVRARVGFAARLAWADVAPDDRDLVHHPVAYLHGREAFAFDARDFMALRRHLNPGGGVLLADAAGGSPTFDAAFRRMVAGLYPDHPLTPIPADDPFFSFSEGFDLSRTRRTEAAGGNAGLPDLEGVKVDGRWAVIYSRLDLGDALLGRAEPGCRGYVRDDAAQVAAHVLLYATLP